MRCDKALFANDVEAAGHRLLVHPTLSLGVCLITREPLTFDEANEKGFVFYAELQPPFLVFEKEAMRVGCSQLVCLEERRKHNSHFDPTHQDFDPLATLVLMQATCEAPDKAVARLLEWFRVVGGTKKVEGVTDTVFFDSGHFNLNFGLHSKELSPYRWTGLDLDSIYRGYMNDPEANLRDLRVPDDRLKPHRADWDAWFLAKVARVLLYEKMGW